MKKGISRPQDSGILGITDKAIPTDHLENTTLKFQVPLDHQARRSVMKAVQEAECYKAQAIALIRQMSIR